LDNHGFNFARTQVAYLVTKIEVVGPSEVAHAEGRDELVVYHADVLAIYINETGVKMNIIRA